MNHHLELRAMTIDDAMDICSWRYEAPYDGYNFPSWQDMKAHDMEFANEHIRNQQYRSVYQHGKLIGFIQLFPLLKVIRLAVFLAPAYCNQGLGQFVVNLAVQAARALDHTAEIDLEVECWNQRAIQTYSKAGFVITDQYDIIHRGSKKGVYCMVYQATDRHTLK